MYDQNDPCWLKSRRKTAAVIAFLRRLAAFSEKQTNIFVEKHVSYP